MDMKSYILVGGGLLICLVLLHALVSAWRANRRAPNAARAEVEAEPLGIEADDGTAMEAEAELTRELFFETAVVESDAGVPVLMERTDVSVDADADADADAETESENADADILALADDDATLNVEATQATQDGPENLRKGRRIEIPGKRTEPTVPRAMRPPDYHEFVPAGERQAGSPESNGVVVFDEVIVIWLFAKSGGQLDGEALLKAFVSHGLKCDSDRVFKKTDPRCGGHWYTVANGVEPGTFDISRPAALQTPGIVMLLSLGPVRDPGAAFENMLDVAQDLAISLDGELKDERRSDMSGQTIEHCRQRIRDFKRMLLRA